MVISFFMPQTSAQYLHPFLDYLSFEKGYSKHTVLAYTTDLHAFLDFLKVQYGDILIADVNASIIRTWLASLKEEGLGTKSINRKISTLKSFYKFLLRKQLLKSSPMATIISPKNPKRLPQFVSEEDTHTLFEHVAFPETFRGFTDKLVVALLYQTGMRRGELISIKEQDVDFYLKTIKILGKGGKERMVPAGDNLLDSIKEYISAKPVGTSSVPAYLLVNEKGNMLYPKYIYNTVTRYLALVTTIEKKSPHILRHSFATHLASNGADLNAVKSLLGHASLASTQIYTHNSIAKLKSVFAKAHPKA